MKGGRESHRWPNPDSVGDRLSAYPDNLQLSSATNLANTRGEFVDALIEVKRRRAAENPELFAV